MSPPFDLRAEAIFHEALETAPEQRSRLVSERCGNDAALLAEVESLLSHHHESNGVLDYAVVKSPSPDESRTGAPHDDLPPLRQAGGFRVISVLGSGGMGVVYLSEQEKPRRTVALKVIRPALASAAAKRRFEHEAELLARLQHPGIAQIYEAGVANFGHGPQQFIAMELVRGEPLTAWARSRHCDMPTRLRLMIRVCEAVHHAHQRGVIHRDLKPANILVVTEASGISKPLTSNGSAIAVSASSDGVLPQPKILDFGVARVLDSDVAITTMQTSAGQLVGTLRYMSPEQIAGDPGAIDARSDIYTLGTILYELLAGRLPHNLESCSIPDAARIIRDQPHTSLSSINRLCRGDVDIIVSKALEKDPRRRYQSAVEMALDLERHLANQPIIARPASAMYSARKFVRRNKAVVSGVVIAFIALIVGVVGTTGAMFEARSQRAEAERQVRITKAINQFLNEDLLALADPMKQPDASLTLREALDRSAAVVDERFKNQPEIAVAIHTTIGLAYQNLAIHDAAQEHLQKARDLCRSQVPRDLGAVASAENLLAVIQFHRGNLDQSEAGYKQAIALLTEQSGPDPPDLAGNLIGLALIEQARGNLTAAEPLIRKSLQSKIAVLGEDDPEVAHAKDALAGLLADLGKHDESERLFREALVVRENKLGPDHYMTLLTVNNLAVLLISRAKLDEAQSLLRRVLTAWENTLGEQHPAIATLHHNLADIARRQGDVVSAERELRSALQSFRNAYGDDHDYTMTTTTVLAELLLQTNRPDDAEPLVREALERRSWISGPDHPATLVAVMDLGWLFSLRGDIVQAISHYEQGLGGRRRVLGDDHPATLRAMGQLANLHSKAGHHENAEGLYRELADRRTRLNGSADPATIGTVANLARNIAAQGRFSDSQPLFQSVLDRRRVALKPDDPELALALQDVGQNHLDLEQYDLAEQMLRQAVDIHIKAATRGSPQLRRAQVALGVALTKMDRFADAEPILLEVDRDIQANQPIDSESRNEILEHIVAMYMGWQKSAEVERYRALIRENQGLASQSQ